MTIKPQSSYNRSVTIDSEEIEVYKKSLITINNPIPSINSVVNKIIHQDMFDVLDYLPSNSIDVIFADPPYNLTKEFNSSIFKSRSIDSYDEWVELWVSKLPRLLKPTSSVYICGDWRSSTSIHRILEKYFIVQNRITWEREKGRGAKRNWKNTSEDIWFATVSDKYIFNVNDVMLKKKVIASYKKDNQPKDWEQTDDGKFRSTYPSNLWTDISVPFWSMPENTIHPTQKPEKLLAKIILASSNPNDIVFDPFSGSGTTAVTAKKLNRQYVGIELDEMYACLSEKRLELVNENKTIQGYSDNVFWERNSQPKK